MTIVEFQVIDCSCACHEPKPLAIPTKHACVRCDGVGRLLWRPTDDEHEVEVLPLPEGWAA